MIYWCYSDIFDCDEPRQIEADSKEEAAEFYTEQMQRLDGTACHFVCVASSRDAAFDLDGEDFEIQWSAKAVR